jgi:hypothetical protein
MPIRYERDDTRRRIRVTLADPLTVADLLASVERQYAEGAWPYGVLVDARTPCGAPQPGDMRAFVSGVRELVDAHGPRGPIALVAREAGAISSAQLYNVFGGKTESIEVFWDLDDAHRWLDDRLAQHARKTPKSD